MLEKRVDLNDADAMCNLADMYSNGQYGVKKDGKGDDVVSPGSRAWVCTSTICWLLHMRRVMV
jgi:hypothetical protein